MRSASSPSASRVTWPGYHGSPAAASGATRTRVVAPDQRARPQIVERRRPASSCVGPVADQRRQLGQRYAAAVGLQHQQRVEHRQVQEVQAVGGGLDRLPGLRPGGQRGDGPGRRLGEIRAQLEQADELIVGQLGQPGAQRHDGS